MAPTNNTQSIQFALPKGRTFASVISLLSDAGVRISESARNYRPSIALDQFEVKILKPRAIIEMLHSGARDLGFAGLDWVREDGADVVEILDTGLDPVSLIAAAPTSLVDSGEIYSRRIVVASEYVNIARSWIEKRDLNAELLRSFGATEVLPPDDADCIVDNTATGATLASNNLRVFDELMTSSTRLFASRKAMASSQKRERIESLAMLLRSVLEARTRVMIELNVPADKLARVAGMLPCMREPTVSTLHSSEGFAIKAAISRDVLPSLIPSLKYAGGTDIVVSTPGQIVP
ncbi:MAG: ATP phosphoribosyltransferase [Planctomycetota bacterium]|jgi:ATP phosphoribosyltransferase